MGNYLCRVFIGPAVPATSVEDFARALIPCPATLFFRDFSTRKFRKPQFIAAQKAGMRLIDFDVPLSADKLSAAAESTFGPGRYLVRVADDDELDETRPRGARLDTLFPGVEPESFLNPLDEPITWTTDTLHPYGGNPPAWGLRVPLRAALLSVALPGQQRRCPMCQTAYVSRGDRGQCPACGFVAYPFTSVDEARRIVAVHVDDGGWTHCARCRWGRTFTKRVEQCTRCGQLLKADSTHSGFVLQENEVDIVAKVQSLMVK